MWPGSMIGCSSWKGLIGSMATVPEAVAFGAVVAVVAAAALAGAATKNSRQAQRYHRRSA